MYQTLVCISHNFATNNFFSNTYIAHFWLIFAPIYNTARYVTQKLLGQFSISYSHFVGNYLPFILC